MTRRDWRRVSAALIAATLSACSAADFDPNAKYITVFVAKNGVVEVNGEEASLSQLEGALQTAAGMGAFVLLASRPSGTVAPTRCSSCR